MNFPMYSPSGETYSAIRIMLGETAAIDDPSTIRCWGTYNIAGTYHLMECNKWGRYLTIQSMASSVELSLCEVAVHNRPVESLAYKTSAISSSLYSSTNYAPDQAVDMHYKKFFLSHAEKDPWIMIDLGDIYFVHEVSLWSRHDCCYKSHFSNLHVRAGRSLENNGNSNHLCGVSQLYTLQTESLYCDVVGRYVSVQHIIEHGWLVFGEIVVNPETTENIAVHSQSSSANTPRYENNYAKNINDGRLDQCHVMIQVLKKKKVWLEIHKTVVVSKVFIVNNPNKLDEMTDFDIAIGPSTTETTLCLPGLQNMAGMHTASFFCEPRVSGRVVFIKQHREDKQMSICEVALFEETKPLIDRKKDLYVWCEINKDITLTCQAKGYPSPVLTWVRNNEVIESGSNTFQLSSVSSNQSGEYECWANNTHGVDLKIVDVVISSNLRVCTDSLELQFVVGKPENNEIKLKGSHWYSVYDSEERKYLQFVESLAKLSSQSSCRVWLNGKHPEDNDGVVSRTLCVKNETNACSRTLDIYIRKCTRSYIYNFKDLMSSSGPLTFCFQNGPRTMSNAIKPVISFPIANHALSQKVFQTETEVQESYKCLMMCQLEPRCRSFNFSKKFKVCELNTATKIQFPGNYGVRENYEYYHMNNGITIAVKGEL